MTEKVEFSHDGPKCPKCGFTFTPDEGCYYAPTYEKDKCQECGCEFSVVVHHSTEWETRPLSAADANYIQHGGKP
jgi:hypothetical protein